MVNVYPCFLSIVLIAAHWTLTVKVTYQMSELYSTVFELEEVNNSSTLICIVPYRKRASCIKLDHDSLELDRRFITEIL